MIKDVPTFYSIRSLGERGFLCASGYGPLGSMPFFDGFHQAVQERKRRFWEVNPMHPGIYVGETGTKWADVMYCGASPPSEFYSQKVVDSLSQANIELRRTTAVPIGSVESEKLQLATAPNYFVIEPEVGISIDYAESGIEIDASGQPILPRGVHVIAYLDPLSWTGADLFKCSNWERGGMDLLCTERVKKIAEETGWTNVEFVRQRVKGVNPFTGKAD